MPRHQPAGRSAETMVDAAIAVAEEGLLGGELPIGAVLFHGDEQIASSHTRERREHRHLVHAELLTLQTADRKLGLAKHDRPLVLAVNLEPCVMCVGAAMVLGVTEIYYGLDSPGDGGAQTVRGWVNRPEAPFFAAPAITGGIRRSRVLDQFARYCATADDTMARRWAQTLVAAG